MLTKGYPAECTAQDPVSVTIKGDELTFTDSAAKNYTISFSPRPDGTFGQLSANIGGMVVAIRGHVGGGVLDAEVTSSTCEHHWHLDRKSN